MSALALLSADTPPIVVAEETRDRLLAKLARQREFGREMHAWYEGRQSPAISPRPRAEPYRVLVGMATTPWARLVVDTIAERLEVQGYQSGSNDTDEDDAAWRILQRSHVDADQRLVYLDALLTGQGYVSIAPPADDDPEALPLLAIESSMEVTHEHVLGNRRIVAAALKLFPADWTLRNWIAELYTPLATWRWFAQVAKQIPAGTAPVDQRRLAVVWELDAEPTPNDFGVVPIVPFENRQTILGGGRSEIADLTPILRRIDKLTLDSLLTSEYSSFRQRWATGLDVPKNPETGKPVEPFQSSVDRLWINTSADGKFGSFDQSDIAQYLRAIDAQIAALAAISRVPSHYLLQSELANPPSAESLIAGESGLVAKVRERQRQFGEAWELAIRIAFLQAGQDDWAADAQSAIVWADAELRNPAQVADAAVKLQTIGVPQAALWRYVGATPQEIDAWRIESAAQALLAPPPVVANG